MNTALTDWLLASDEPWTRYRTRVDLLEQPEDDAEVRAARRDMLAHPQVKALLDQVATWGQRPLTRHNDAGHPLYALSTLADFGVRAADRGLASRLKPVLTHQAPEGAFLTPLKIPAAFGGTDKPDWQWMACDAPAVLSGLLAMGLGDDPRLARALAHLAGLVEKNGWRCAAGASVGKFRGPGRKLDPCPIANVYALQALAMAPAWQDSAATRAGAHMLLDHWQNQKTHKYYLFGIGSDFRKLKYPLVWYDLLHVTEVLSHLPFVHADPRFGEMVAALTSQADGDGRYTATSMYQTWKGWSFADKKAPSPWLTLAVLRLTKRLGLV